MRNFLMERAILPIVFRQEASFLARKELIQIKYIFSIVYCLHKSIRVHVIKLWNMKTVSCPTVWSRLHNKWIWSKIEPQVIAWYFVRVSWVEVKRTFVFRFAPYSWTHAASQLVRRGFTPSWHKHPPVPPPTSLRFRGGGLLICVQIQPLCFPDCHVLLFYYVPAFSAM